MGRHEKDEAKTADAQAQEDAAASGETCYGPLFVHGNPMNPQDEVKAEDYDT